MTKEEQLSEFIEHLKRQHQKELEDNKAIISGLKNEINKLGYALKGALADQVNLKITLSPENFMTANIHEAIEAIYKTTTRNIAGMVEENLGKRYELHSEYYRAVEYIRYLQHHAAGRGVQFTEFSEKLFH